MEFFDVSLPVSGELPVWPGDPAVQIERISSMSQGEMANLSKLTCRVHVGTHVDAPLHFVDGGKTITELALGSLVGPALVVEFPAAPLIDEAILAGAEIPNGVQRLLFKTRNSHRWQAGEKEFSRQFVALDESGAQWLVERGVKLVGVDYLSVAPFDQPGPTHQVLLGAEVVIVEGLDLHEIEPGEYQLICLPLKLVGSEGAPARAILTRSP